MTLTVHPLARIRVAIRVCFSALAVRLIVLPLPRVPAAAGGCFGAVSIAHTIPPFAGVFISRVASPYLLKGALAMEVPVLPFASVLAAILVHHCALAVAQAFAICLAGV